MVFLLDFYHQNRFEFFYGFFRAFQHGEFLPYRVYLYEIQPFQFLSFRFSFLAPAVKSDAFCFLRGYFCVLIFCNVVQQGAFLVDFFFVEDRNCQFSLLIFIG